MASLFGSDPELASSSSSQLAEIRDQIDPVGQWLGDPDAIGVPEVGESLGEFANAASSLTDDLTTRVGGASDLLGALASGTREVDESLADRLGLVPTPSGPAQPGGAAPVGAGGRDLVGASTGAGAPRDPGNVCTGGDPVDVATGDVILRETDVTLPGSLPLVLERCHRSSWRTGRWFGRSWLSSFDQRLLITADRVIGAFSDGRVLTWTYPDGSGDFPMLPVFGAAWPLRRNPDGSFTVTDPQRGLTWRFEHRAGSDASAAAQAELPLVSLSDRVGHEIAFSYNEAGQPASAALSDGYHVQVTVTDGHVTGLALGDVPLVSYQYDADGNLAEVINSSGQPLRFSYDQVGRLTGWLDRNDHSYRYTYDGQGRCVRGEGPGGSLSGTFSYEPGISRWTDTAGAVTTYEVSDSALVIAITDPLGNVTRWEHDERGRVTTRVDPLSRVTRYAYDDRGNLVTLTRPDGSQATAEYDDQCQPLLLTGPDGSIWRQEYNSRGNRTGLTAPDGAVTRFGYDNRGHLASVTAPDGAMTLIVCEAAGLPVEVTYPDGARVRHDLDRLGRVARITGPDGGITRLDWTTEGKLASRTLPDGATETWTWDVEGNLTRYDSAAGAVTRYEHGPFDRATAMRWPDGTRTEFRYDQQLRLNEVVHSGLSWSYEYDLAGRLIAEADYNGATTTYSYDQAGQLTQRANAVGQEVAFGYDVLGNLVERSADGAVTVFGYDPAGRITYARNADAEVQIERDAIGRVTAETCNGRTVTTDYDVVGRVARRIAPSGATTSWEYGPAGLPVAMTADGHQLRFGYDAAGQETRRELPGGLTLTQDWDLRGRLVIQALGDAALTGPGQPETSVAGLPAGHAVGRQLLERRAYSYRADGLVVGIDDLLAGTRAVVLDRSGRVTAVSGPDWAERYAYDSVGNLTEASWPAPPPGSTMAWLDPGSQGRREITGTLISRAGNIRYRHDQAGRVVTRQRARISRKPESWNYQWTADDRLAGVTTPDGSTWRYSYDPFGRRIAKQRLTLDGQVLQQTTFYWDGANLAEQTDTTDDREHVTAWNYRPGTFTALTQAEHTSPRDTPQDEIDQQFYAIITDLTGTPSELTTPNGKLAGHLQHVLWGGTLWNPNGAQSPLRFPGQYADPETGLYYNFHRHYDPTSGSYLTPDPLGLLPAPNPHAYVFNPFALADPLGLQPAPCTANDWYTYPKTGYYPEAMAAQQRAQELKSQMGWGGSTVSVIGVRDIDTGQIVNRITINGSGGMPSAWKLGPGEEFLPGIEGYHAEENTFETLANYEEILYGGASTNICMEYCAPLMKPSGLILDGPIFRSPQESYTAYRTFYRGWRY
jgi:RHS repeat-associated protein